MKECIEISNDETMNENWDDLYKKKWDERYKEEAYVYGTEPNEFFKEWLPKFKAGKILMPADGEGRNGVYAAIQGWAVTSFDLSEVGKQKALNLARKCKVTINYLVGDFEELSIEKEQFNAIGLIYAHVAATKKQQLHHKMNNVLKPGGVIILEAFSKSHLQYSEKNAKVGGPKELEMLYSKKEILADFKGYHLLFLEEQEITLNEGTYHTGTGSVIRFAGIKK